ncbi:MULTISPECIES: NAD(P)-binding domain-containing protein [unclassified Streptomyces]|uniref:NADPH-dependent F420 reductase n=1 Tax=unclassified Streptomyces TaxID=2593676 RepID=UPI002DD8EA53|nr:MULTISPECIES: NAD(P)-binding domain-containing protein [unclassified Streptomyces]WSA91594.1 NAD(P)-binding domain-containing protein [Streptomyces sp. NBC_01795]WSB75964.1 NAD(P)-binding domain-containing protein [Streptomyces sp. NBC_01775]WSS44599.1 NAD(P)-binding domain-containing protein [Streptomyces sp. NBC_01187]
MRIGILGAAGIATGLGGAMVRAGHEVFIGARNPGSAKEAAATAGAAGHGTLDGAAAHGDAVLAALPAGAAPAVAELLAGALAGRTLIDCTNDLTFGADGPVFADEGAPPVARRIADAAPDAHVVKAFNLCHESVWSSAAPESDGRPLGVPLCGDDSGAVARTAGLITSLGCTPLRLGGLSRAAYLEATAAFAIGAAAAGAEPRLAFALPMVGPAPA